MQLSRTLKAGLWGFAVGGFFAGVWFRPMVFGSRPEPMLMSGQSRTDVTISEIVTGAEIFFGAGVPVALLVYWRPGKRGDHDA
jgi:hypothetical protein